MRADLETVRGELRSIKQSGADFWTVAELTTAAGVVAVVGKLVGARIGDTVEMQGGWSTHAKYGKQFKFSRLDVVLPADKSGIVGWLQSKLPDVGHARATALVEKFGNSLWEVIEKRPDELLAIDGITEARRDAIVKAYETHRRDRDRMIGFKSWGLTDKQIAKVVAELGDGAEKALKKNPYVLADLVHGFGFKRADVVALRMGVPLDAPARIRAALLFTLNEAAQAGHVFVPSGALCRMSLKVLGSVRDQAVKSEYEQSAQAGVFVSRRGRVYLKHLDRAEAAVAERLFAMVSAGASDRRAA